jgi:hypothetical protein
LEPLDYWRLSDVLTVLQAALLLVGEDPSQSANVENWEVSKRPAGYEAVKWAIVRGLQAKTILGTERPFTRTVHHEDESYVEELEISGSVDVATSTVHVGSLRDWLRERGFTEGFFFPAKQPEFEFLDRKHPRFAPKLAAAVKAWRTMADVEMTKGKSPKQALMKWLREHALEFGLTDEEGKPNETGIEEIAKVANWAQSGGAPRTPAGEDEKEEDGIPF